MSLDYKIKSLAREVGFDLVGISKLDKSKFQRQVEAWVNQERHGNMKWYEKNLDRRVEPNKHLGSKAISAITVGLYYRPAEIPDKLKNDPSRGLIARYARYDDYHKVIEKMLKLLASDIGKLINKNWEYHAYTDTGPVLEREIGAKGGLGFIGKNTTLINPSLGSYFFLAEIVCDIEFKSYTGIDAKAGTCGLCQRCQIACPTKALLNAYELDARRCISYLTIENKGPIPIEFRPLIGNLIYGCDICQEVCPWNKRLPADLITKLKPRLELVTPRLLDMASLSEDEFKKYFKGTPILRAKYRGFIRNVLVALGNWGSKKALGQVQVLADSQDELIKEHAIWALDQIKIKNR